MLAERLYIATRDHERLRHVIATEPSFTNPILPSPSADPWVIQHGGFYYHCESRNQESIVIRRASCLTQLGDDPGMEVWSTPAFGANSKSVWSPELHFLEGRWYIYYTADDGLNENHRMWVLESVSADPLGGYRCRGMLDTQGWAIDGTVMRLENDDLYFVWSGWPGRENGTQNLYIAPMGNPYTIIDARVLISAPQHTWERVDMPINEAPQVLQKDGRTFIVYSASGSWTEDYCMGLLQLNGPNPLRADAWLKSEVSVFSKTTRVWGVGHCSFVKSPDGAEDWMVYHTKSSLQKGWKDRRVHAQRFSWSQTGTPSFGQPTAAGIPISIPSNQPVPKRAAA